MRNEVYIILFIFLLVNPTVLATLCLSRSKLTKKTLLNLNAPAAAINYCGQGGAAGGAGQQPQQRQKTKIDFTTYVPPNNKILQEFKDFEIIFTDDAESEVENKSDKSKKNQKKEDSKKKTLVSSNKKVNQYQPGQTPQPQRGPYQQPGNMIHSQLL